MGAADLTASTATAPAPVEPPAKLTLAQLQNTMCPHCKVGAVRVDTYDPDALYERGQWPPGRGGEDYPPDYSSGGAYHYTCTACGKADSAPLAPGPKFGTGGVS